ncbi:uncharacterized protein LOC110815549 [Carica papaya]|uniref:uncharacterized protein LOC110815549 n=1 Tax=Carica papaya TaxID=3649 RepID=UPI000B8C93C5|nr:uncharacterized protein LOC110815549 [Carica papaya]
MANGTDSGEFLVLSRVRTGLKREFEFALKVQSEICGSLGRTRSRKTMNGMLNNAAISNQSAKKNGNKKLKSCDLKEAGTNKDVDKDQGMRNLGDPMKIDEAGINEEEEEAKSDVLDFEEAKVDSPESVKEVGGYDEAIMHIGEEESVLMELGKSMREEEQEKTRQEGGEGAEKSLSNGHGFKFEAEQRKDKDEKNDYGKAGMDKEKHGSELQLKEPDKALVDVREENKEDLVEDVLKKKEISLLNVADSKGSPVTILRCVNNVKVGTGLVEKPSRRFTRSLLKPKVEISKKSAPISDSHKTSVKGIGDRGNGKGTDYGSCPTVATPTKLGMKISTRSFPTKLKDLLDSGILEGVDVKYLRGSKARGRGTATGLRGVIVGSGILCFCSACNGNEIVNPTVYELHAGSSNKRPPEYIFLENGNTLRDVMNACKDASLGKLEETLSKAVGPFMKKSRFCLNCREYLFSHHRVFS